MSEKLLLPGGVQISEPEQDTMLLLRGLEILNQTLLGIQRQLDIQLRVAVGADSKAAWKKAFAENDTRARAEARARKAEVEQPELPLSDEPLTDGSEDDMVEEGGEV